MAELGEDTALKVDKEKIKQPDVLKKAADVASKTLDLGATSPEERNRMINYRAQPLLDYQKKLTTQNDQQMESAGLRFSTERRDKLTEINRETGRQLGESVLVPLLQQEREQSRADLNTAAQIGTSQAQLAQSGEAMRVSAEQFAANLGLDKDKFAETVRQYNNSDETQKAQFAASLGMDKARLDETVRQYNGEMTQRQTEFAETLSITQSNAAFERASQSYDGVDPITGLKVESLQARNTKLNENVARATQIGLWMEQGVPLNARSILTALGLDPDDFLEPGADGAAADGGADGDGIANEADAARARLVEQDAEAVFVSELGSWSQRLGGAPPAVLQRFSGIVGRDEARKVFAKIQAGPVSLAEMTQQYGFDAFFALSDFLVVTGTDANGQPIVGLPGSSGASGGADGDGARNRNAANLLAAVNGGTWTQASVDPIVAGVKDGSISRAQVQALKIAQYRKDHIMNLAGM